MPEKKPRNSTKMPDIVFAEASVKSVGPVSLFEESTIINSDTVNNFYSESQLINSATERLRAEGFEVMVRGDTTITIAAPPKVFERAFNTTIETVERDVIKELGRETTATFLECPETAMQGFIDTSGSALSDVLEGVALNEPVYYMSSTMEPLTTTKKRVTTKTLESGNGRPTLMQATTPSAFPPQVDYWHLDVPADVSLGMNADRAHRYGITGRGVRVAMVDSGWYRHPFFKKRGYRASSVILGPAARYPNHDEHGHGTGESANIFAVAPDVRFTMVKMNFVNSIGAFNAAVRLRPDIITCSWGSDIRNRPLSAGNQALAAAVANAVRRGIIVIFAAGNGHFGFPGQHPDVISAGGVYMLQDGSFKASNYASGFASNVYSQPVRKVPDVCGLVGELPKAQYIMLPVEPRDHLDDLLSGGDSTLDRDGWAAFSGTSAAAPQLAGICALIKQSCPQITPRQARSILKRTARDVTTGNSNPRTGGNPATPGVDLATGNGLADAFRAALIARIRCFFRPRITRTAEAETLETTRLVPGPTSFETLEPSGNGLNEDEINTLEEMILEN